MISDIPFLDKIELDDAEILESPSHRNMVSSDAEILGSHKPHTDTKKEKQ